MEKFLVLTTITEQRVANHYCAVLEDAGIPVIIEHVEILDGSLCALGYRLLVPAEFTGAGMRILQNLAQNRASSSSVSKLNVV